MTEESRTIYCCVKISESLAAVCITTKQDTTTSTDPSIFSAIGLRITRT